MNKMMSKIIPKVKPTMNIIVKGFIPLSLWIIVIVKSKSERTRIAKQVMEINFEPYRLVPQQQSCLAMIILFWQLFLYLPASKSPGSFFSLTSKERTIIFQT